MGEDPGHSGLGAQRRAPLHSRLECICELPAPMKVMGEEAPSMALYINTPQARKKPGIIRATIGQDGRLIRHLKAVYKYKYKHN